MRIACLHTSPDNASIFDNACADTTLRLHHEVCPDLLASAEVAGSLTRAIAQRTAESLRCLGAGHDAVILTCSTLGPAVDLAAPDMSVPVLRADAALAEETVGADGPIVVLCTAPTSLEPTRALFDSAARGASPRPDIRLVPGAWDWFKAGQLDRYLTTVAAAADDAFVGGAGVVALAQVSMTGAAALCRAGRPRTSPAASLAAAVCAVRGTSPREPQACCR